MGGYCTRVVTSVPELHSTLVVQVSPQVVFTARLGSGVMAIIRGAVGKVQPPVPWVDSQGLRKLSMSARLKFYFAAIVALVLILASVPSHATERRDPPMIQDAPQTQAARSSSLVHATVSAAKPEQNTTRKQKQARSKSAVRNTTTGENGTSSSKGSK
jgi:hypothetical protein